MEHIQGLTEQEVLRRRELGEGNDVKLRTSRTYRDIIFHALFNLVHVVLFILGLGFILMGRWSDAFNSAGLILVNVTIQIVQEIRAKRKLDEIAVLSRPRITVIREGQEKEIAQEEVVRGDVIVVQPGDQMVVDGPVLEGKAEIDESLLTGESDAIIKTPGDEILSGSFCISGSALYQADKVGEKSFANRLTATAREFKVQKTPLQRRLDYIIRLLTLMAIFFGALLFIGAFLSGMPTVASMQSAAVIAGLIPVGLFFITIVSYALGAVRLLDKGALIQVTNAVESLSNVDVLCTDKTGTLTANRIEYRDVVPLAGLDKAEVERALGDFARSASVVNKTSQAVIEGVEGAQLPTVDEVPFSSKLKWSAVAFDDETRRGVYVMGAMEMLEPYLGDIEALRPIVHDLSEQGLRVLIFARNEETTQLHAPDGDTPTLPRLTPIGVISFGDQLRDHVKETIEDFYDAGVELKVISGDNPETVAALAKQAGLDEDIILVSGPELAEMNDAEFAQAAEEASIFGRISPDQKERLVEALQGAGHYVAMIGDGVNDVLSLKKAHLGIAMESGSAATRGVADIILLGDSFGAMGPAFREGQRIVSGMQGITWLYVTRILSVALLMTSAAVMGLHMPFVPPNMALYAMLTVGIPTILMAFWAQPRRDVDTTLPTTLYFAIPAAFLTSLLGVIIYVAVYYVSQAGLVSITITPEMIEHVSQYLGYALTTEEEVRDAAATIVARSALTPFVIFVGLLLINFARPSFGLFAVFTEKIKDKRMFLVSLVMLVAYFAVVLIGPLRKFYGMLLLPTLVYVGIGVFVLIWFGFIWFAYKRRLLQNFLDGTK